MDRLGIFHAGRASMCLCPRLDWGLGLAPRGKFGPSCEIFFLTF